MSKWLRIDNSTGAGYIQKFFSGSPALGSGFTLEMDVYVPTPTAQAILDQNGAGNGFTSDWFQIQTNEVNWGGVYAEVDAGPSLVPWYDRSPTVGSGTIPLDAIFHIKFQVVFNSGTSWDIITSINGTVVDTYTWDTGTDGSTDSFNYLQVGGIFPDVVSGEIYFVSNIVVKDSSGTTFFSDDFTDVTIGGSLGVWNSTVGTSRLSIVDAPSTPLPPAPPVNDSCANAQTLLGCGGTVIADNTLWAGVWPIGNDPLFNAIGHGGGAPLLYKWTNNEGQRLLFRVTVKSPPDHPVDYNFGMNIGTDCSSLVFYSDTSIVDIGLGPGCIFDNNLEGGTYDNYETADFFGPEFTTSFDIIVDPGHTVYFEIDSYTGISTEPPVADSSHRGKFQFDWAALTYTTDDKMEGGGFDCEPHSSSIIDPVQLTDWRTDGGDPNHTITAWDTFRVGDRLMLHWAYESDDNSTSWYAGDCALDGSDLHFERYIDRHGAANAYPSHTTPKMITNGTDVFIGFGWLDGTVFTNPDYDPTTTGPTTCYYFYCDDSATRYRYEILKWDSTTHSWNSIVSIPMHAMVNQNTDLGYSYFLPAVCVTEDKVWVAISYAIERRTQTMHRNDYPAFGCGPLTGAWYCTNDRIYVENVFDVFSFDWATSSLVLESREMIEEFEIQHWDHDVPTTDPIFGTWQFFDDGNIFTDPVGTSYPTNRIEAMDMVGDDDYPILVASYLSDSNTIADDVIVKRVDINTVIQDWTYGDFNLGLDTSTKQAINIALVPRYVNPYSPSEHERAVRIVYNGGAIWIMRIKSDFSGGLSYVDPGNPTASNPNLYSIYQRPFTFFPDKKLGQWWTTGFASTSPFGSIFLYNLCGLNWDDVYASLTDGYTSNYRTSPGSMYYDTVADRMTFLHDKNVLKQADVLRDFVICNIGEPCTGCPPSIFWFFRDGQWRQQNVDSVHSLWVYKDGQWIQNCKELQGQLEGTWQT